MGIVADMIRKYASWNSKQETVHFALKLLGYDQKNVKQAADKEVWRTNEEGNHFQFETTTGEIKAGFGGKFNGKKIGTTWGAGHAKASKPQSAGSGSGSGAEKSPNKRYWMHNLPEDKILTAAKQMAAVKKEMKSRANVVSVWEKNFKRGLLTKSEVDERKKEAGLEKFDENMTPEEYVMKCGSATQKANQTYFMGEARDWKKNADSLTKENWDEKDFKLAAALADKYGADKIDGVKVPDDFALETWKKEDLDCWHDLKSKACGGPVSGNEAPDELQYDAGIKERNVKQNPWKSASEKGVSLMVASSHLSKAIGRQVDPDVLLNGRSVSGESLEDLEKEAFQHAISGVYSNERGLKHYLQEKFKANGDIQGFTESAKNHLTTEELKEVSKGLSKAATYDHDIFEELDYSKQIDRLRMYTLLNKGMGGADASEMVNQEKERRAAAEAEQRRQEEEQRKKNEQIAKETQARLEQARKEAEQKRKEDLSKGITSAIKDAQFGNVKSNPPVKLSQEISHQEIVGKIGGPDRTKGSCASVALAYAANKLGFDVLDFRDGLSRSIFSKKTTIKDLAETPGVESVSIPGTVETKVPRPEGEVTWEALEHVETGKEYLLSCGSHCAVVTRTQDGELRYLELQSTPYNNGWKPFEGKNGAKTLKNRFGCQRSRTKYGQHFEQGAVLINIDTLRGCKSFENALQYINTKESDQKKGVGGGVK